MPEARKDGHVKLECKCGNVGCMFCDGGLFACRVCGGLEGGVPDECPGAYMTQEQQDAVYAGTLNYRDGAWREAECSQAMQPLRTNVTKQILEGK